MSETLKRLRQTAAVFVLIVVVIVFLNILGDYRSAADASGDSESSVESTETVDSPEETTETSVVETPVDSLGTVTVIIDGLNFRKEPSASGELIRGLNEGDVLEYLGGVEGWYQVRAPDGVEGYVSASEQFTALKTP